MMISSVNAASVQTAKKKDVFVSFFFPAKSLRLTNRVLADNRASSHSFLRRPICSIRAVGSAAAASSQLRHVEGTTMKLPQRLRDGLFSSAFPH